MEPRVAVKAASWPATSRRWTILTATQVHKQQTASTTMARRMLSLIALTLAALALGEHAGRICSLSPPCTLLVLPLILALCAVQCSPGPARATSLRHPAAPP